MSNTVFPGAIDSITNPTGANTLNSPDHALQHGTENDAITALETKVGVDSSAVTTSFDYKLSGVTGTDKAASKTGTETLTNKTLGSGLAINVGSDATGDTYYRNSGGATARLGIGTANQILAVSAGGLPNWVANPAANNGSTTVNGTFQEATAAQIAAGTATGSTGADLVTNPSTLLPFLSVTGCIQMYGGSSAPTGWVLCDGSSLLRAGTYAALFAVIGTTYGSADGTHFNVPDLRGRVPIGAGTGTGGGASGTGLPAGGTALTARSLGSWLGEETHAMTSGELVGHTHTTPTFSAGGIATNIAEGSASATGSNSTTNSTGSGTPFNVIQPVMGVNFIIKI